MNASQRATRHPKGQKTVGNMIDHIAESFSQEADFNGLFILEKALEKAKELRSFQQRLDEANAIHARCNKMLEENKSNPTH